MRWGEIVERFNHRFEGQYLPGVKTPRPSRTKAGLRTTRARVKRITNHTGLPTGMQPRRGGSQWGPNNTAGKVESEDEMGSSEEEEEEEEDSSEDDGEEARGPRGTRQGDSPPGKKTLEERGRR